MIILDSYTVCSHCGAEVEIPKEILDKARHWQKRIDNEAKNKRERRKTDKKYCQIKKVEK